VWPYLEAFVGDRPVLAHNAAYDVRALAGLLDQAGLPRPDWQVWCTLRMARRLLPRPGWTHGWTLPDLMVRLNIIGPEERAPLWKEHLDRGREAREYLHWGPPSFPEPEQPPGASYGYGWVLHDAEADAVGCARLAAWAMCERRLSVGELLELTPPRSLLDATACSWRGQ
jgi:DNA polymerase III epsilon subunit-like protein